MTRPTDALREAFSVYWRDARDGCEPDQEEMLKAWASDAFKAGVKAALSETADSKDAARYRWLREQESLYVDARVNEWSGGYFPEDFDKFCDSAMRHTVGEEKP